MTNSLSKRKNSKFLAKIAQRGHKSIRLKGFDYTQSGYYFITLCTYKREFLFGEIKDGKMILNEWGKMANDCWLEIPKHFSQVSLDAWVVMPDHFHGVLIINNRPEVGARHTVHQPNQPEQFGKPVSGSIPTIIRSYKSALTKAINLQRQSPGAIVWQRNYYEHIIRDERSLHRIRQYIINNSSKWKS